jgi:hypothetical protein
MKLLTVILILVLFSSCASGRKGFGCKGRESWGGMIKRINKPY